MILSGYQQEAVDRIIGSLDDRRTFANYDVPGAGKTATAINAHTTYGQFPALITVPAHLVLQWRGELIRWGIPADQIAYCPRGMKPAERLTHLANVDAAFTIVSYNMWTSKMYQDLLMHPSWQAYSFDESHRLRKGRQGRGGLWAPISRLRTKTRSKHLKTPLWWLSGTPIVKDASDVFPLLHMANPYRYKSRRDFALETCKTSQTPYGLHIGPVRDPEKFRELLGKYSIRRTWREIPELKDLKKRDIELPIELSPQELGRHRTIKRDYRDPKTGEPLYSSSAMIHALRNLTISAKVDAFTELVEDSSGSRWLAVCWYRESAKLAFDRVNSFHPHTVYIDGGTSEKERQRAIRRYNDTADCILIGTLGALETGLNLQRGQNFAFLEQHYLSTTNEQAVARLLRRGQTGPVLVYHLFAPKTFDARVKRVAEKRGADIDRALDSFLAEEDWNLCTLLK